MSIRKIRKEEFYRLKPLFPDNDEKRNGCRRSGLEQFRYHDADTYILEYSGTCIGELSANYFSRELAEETIPNSALPSLLQKNTGISMTHAITRFICGK